MVVPVLRLAVVQVDARTVKLHSQPRGRNRNGRASLVRQYIKRARREQGRMGPCEEQTFGSGGIATSPNERLPSQQHSCRTCQTCSQRVSGYSRRSIWTHSFGRSGVWHPHRPAQSGRRYLHQARRSYQLGVNRVHRSSHEECERGGLRTKGRAAEGCHLTPLFFERISVGESVWREHAPGHVLNGNADTSACFRRKLPGRAAGLAGPPPGAVHDRA